MVALSFPPNVNVSRVRLADAFGYALRSLFVHRCSHGCSICCSERAHLRLGYKQLRRAWRLFHNCCSARCDGSSAQCVRPRGRLRRRLRQQRFSHLFNCSMPPWPFLGYGLESMHSLPPQLVSALSSSHFLHLLYRPLLRRCHRCNVVVDLCWDKPSLHLGRCKPVSRLRRFVEHDISS